MWQLQVSTLFLQFLTKYLRLFYVLAQFVFTTIDKELDFYHQKLSLPVALGVVEKPKT